MKKSDILKNRIAEIRKAMNTATKEVQDLYNSDKIDEAGEKIKEIEDLQKELENKEKELETALAVENMEYNFNDPENLDDDDKKAFENFLKNRKDTGKVLDEEKKTFLNLVKTATVTNDTSGMFAQGANGTIIPNTIQKDIIDAVEERLDIIGTSTKFNIAGEISFPKYTTDDDNTGITAGYAEDGIELTAGNGKFETVSLKGHLIGVLTKIGKNLLNNTTIQVYEFIIGKVADSIVEFVEKEMTIGNTPNKIEGYETTTNTIEMLGDKVTADDLIAMQVKIKGVFRKNAKWRMSSDKLLEIRRLKDANGNYLLNPDIRGGFGMTLLGNEIEIEENATTICYGDFKGYYTNVVENMEIQILLEKYATQHAIGIVAYNSVDGAPVDTQRYIKLIPKSETPTG